MKPETLPNEVNEFSYNLIEKHITNTIVLAASWFFTGINTGESASVDIAKELY